MTTHSTTTRAVGPSSPGASAGFEVACACGFTFRTAFRTTAEADASSHVAWMAAKAPGREEGERADTMACESGWTGDRCIYPLDHDGDHSN